ncbi:hypothetical protein [Kitasatospora kifunensis]|uniref:Uncharacterized protein n=1 Tax=Kitasatospora kifunensis TaxID=58351 RepID=A0A7W7QYS1_KITKI|nr:hypothetical protein [Kitasatospora kifunensis]MBB4922194.1 hypothetical protein [Kitasatospora kifunensis]
MRLRQAHALITTAAALEAAGIGIEMHPFDVDEYTAPHITTDHMTGFAEYNDPDNPDRDTRIYNIDIYPGPTDYSIAVYVTFGLGTDATPLLSRAFEAAPKAENANTYEHPIAEIADLVVTAIRDHEKPFEAAYAARTEQPSREQP